MSTQMFNFNSVPGQAGGGANGQMFNFGTGSANQTGMLGAGLPNMTPQTSGALPSPNSATPPGIVPSQNSPYTGSPTASHGTTPTVSDSSTGQYKIGSTLDPALTNQWMSWLQSQIGQGMKPYDLSAIDPSTGQPTAPGSLTAPNNQLLQQLMQSFTDPNGIMAQMQKTGMPIDQTPAWKAMVDAMQRQIGEGAANLKEGMNVGGNLVGTPYGTAAADYQDQAAKDLNAQLLESQTKAMESARSRQLSSTGAAASFGGAMQGLDQAAIDRMYQEFQRTQPQNNPLLPFMQSSATAKPDYLKSKDLTDQMTEISAALKNIFAGGSSSTFAGIAG